MQIKDFEQEIIEARTKLNNQLAQDLIESGFSLRYKEGNGDIALEKGKIFVMLKNKAESYFMVGGCSFSFNLTDEADITSACSVLKSYC